jgi:hypothetical protein
VRVCRWVSISSFSPQCIHSAWYTCQGSPFQSCCVCLDEIGRRSTGREVSMGHQNLLLVGIRLAARKAKKEKETGRAKTESGDWCLAVLQVHPPPGSPAFIPASQRLRLAMVVRAFCTPQVRPLSPPQHPFSDCQCTGPGSLHSGTPGQGERHQMPLSTAISLMQEGLPPLHCHQPDSKSPCLPCKTTINHHNCICQKKKWVFHTPQVIPMMSYGIAV